MDFCIKSVKSTTFYATSLLTVPETAMVVTLEYFMPCKLCFIYVKYNMQTVNTLLIFDISGWQRVPND